MKAKREVESVVPQGSAAETSAGSDVDGTESEDLSAKATMNEILEQKNQEIEALKAELRVKTTSSDNFKRFLLENPIPMLFLDPNLAIKNVNAAFLSLSGFSRDEIVGTSFNDLVIIKVEGESVQDCIRTKNRVEGMVEIEFPSGKKNLRRFTLPSINEKGDVDNLLVVYIDETEQRRQNEETTMLTKRAANFVRYNPLAIAVLANDKSRLDLNEQYQKVWRGSYDELMKKKLYDFDITITGGDDFYASFAEKRMSRSEMEVRWGGNEKSYLTLFQVPVFDDQGEIDVNYYIYLDHTESHEQLLDAQRLRGRGDAFVRDNPLAIAVLANDKSRLDLNEQYQKVWRGSYDELMKKKLYDFDITITGGDDFYASFNEKRKAVTHMEVRWGGNEKSYLTLFQVPVFDDQGEIDVNYYIYLDLTPEKELAAYRGEYISTLSDNLDLLAHGNLDFNLELAAANQYTADTRTVFQGINSNLEGVQQAIDRLVTDGRHLAGEAMRGNLRERADVSAHQGVYQDVIKGINGVVEAIEHPITETVQIANRFAQADFSRQWDEQLTVQGEFETLKVALNEVSRSISLTVGDVITKMEELTASAQQTNASLEEVSGGSQAVARAVSHVSTNSEQVSVSIAQVLKAMEDMSAAVEEVTSSMESVSHLARETNDLSKQGTELAGKAEQSMGEIEASSTKVQEIVNDIGGQMNQIGKIVGLIRDLANQTNLLALNAAIEAARAGDAGRGFAVVAAEVKSLAQESRNSAENIEEMIGSLRENIQLASNAIDDSGKTVGHGTEVIGETIAAFVKIADSIGKIARSTEEVASASEEQAATVEEISASVHEVTRLVDETAKQAGDAAATTEESSVAIDEIARMVEQVSVIAMESLNVNRRFVIVK
jgi:methyl-accepting chemotaxis protein